MKNKIKSHLLNKGKIYFSTDKLLCIFIVGIILLGGINTAALKQAGKTDIKSFNNTCKEKLKFTITSSYPEIIEYERYVKVKIKEANNLFSIPKKPMLPYYSSLYTFPLGTKIIDVKCNYSEPKLIQIDKEIYTTPQIKMRNNNLNNHLENYFDFLNYETDFPNINNYYSFKTSGGIKDGKQVTFFINKFYPVCYIPEKRAIRFIEKAEFEVVYERSINPLVFEEDYSLVIITPSIFSKQLQPIIPHKKNYGLTSIIVTLEDIFKGKYFAVEGRDDAEKIKYFIKNTIEQWGTSFILLVGDIYKMPIRTTWIGELNVITDLYYADVFFPDGNFSSWDTDGDGRYGEYWQETDDIVDLYADVYIGRLACRNSNEVKTSVNKIINYEKSVYGKKWFKNIILCGGDTHPFFGVYEGEVTLDEIEKCMPDFTPIKLYASQGNFSPTLINKAVNNGAGFFAYAGHGFENGFGTHRPNSNKWIKYTNFNKLGLLNFNKLPIVFFDACLTARLDFTLGDLLNIKFIKFPFPCFAWSLVKKPFGGAVATLGATRVAYGVVTENGPKSGSGYLALKFFENYDEGIRVGEMLVGAQIDYLNNIEQDPFTVEEFILLGDPSLMIGGYNE